MNILTATSEELQHLPGIGLSKAARIVKATEIVDGRQVIPAPWTPEIMELITDIEASVWEDWLRYGFVSLRKPEAIQSANVPPTKKPFSWLENTLIRSDIDEQTEALEKIHGKINKYSGMLLQIRQEPPIGSSVQRRLERLHLYSLISQHLKDLHHEEQNRERQLNHLLKFSIKYVTNESFSRNEDKFKQCPTFIHAEDVHPLPGTRPEDVRPPPQMHPPGFPATPAMTPTQALQQLENVTSPTVVPLTTGTPSDVQPEITFT